MNRARHAFAASLVGACFAGAVVLAQSAPKAPPMTSVLAGKKFVPPLRGQAEVEFTQPVTKKDPKTNMVVTTIKVKNMSNAPIGRLTIDETWYDKGGNLLTGSKGFLKQLLQPGEVASISIETPYSPEMNAINYNFTHANGTVKPKKVASLDEPKEPATKTAAASKTTAAKKK